MNILEMPQSAFTAYSEMNEGELVFDNVAQVVCDKFEFIGCTVIKRDENNNIVDRIRLLLDRRELLNILGVVRVEKFKSHDDLSAYL